ncbi:hypothetical protein GQ44DRAFT_714226 [Phaeosphaeriaceae sp. PMI808]|nr:hypothetical protein GQ44DRAFT_714226 [Phaeosphaeriaceae sp. PMI808]
MSHPIIDEELPLVLTPESGRQFFVNNHRTTRASAQARVANDRIQYVRMKQALLLPTQINRLIHGEYISFLQNCVQPFVRIEEMEGFLQVFYPSAGPGATRQLSRQVLPLVVIFPYDLAREETFDIMPLMQFLADTPTIQCLAWASDALPITQNALNHSYQIGSTLFNPQDTIDPEIIFYQNSNTIAPSDCLRAYIAANPGSISRIMFQAHGWDSFRVTGQGHQRRMGSQRAKLHIWFADGPTAPAWVDGGTWAWPEDANAVRTSARTRQTADHQRRRELYNFLHATGLYVREISCAWEIRLGVEGRHAVGGRNIKKSA